MPQRQHSWAVRKERDFAPVRYATALVHQTRSTIVACRFASSLIIPTLYFVYL